VTRAFLDKRPRDVAEMFDGVARRYDLTNTVLSGGMDRGWRRATVAALALGPRDTVLDLAAGTAVSTVQLGSCAATAIACDFSLGMLKAGKARGRHVPMVADVDAALRELGRVTRPGGRLVVCEFSRPTWAPWRTVYTEYLMRALPAVARRVSSNPDAYGYLAESIRAWPDQLTLARRIEAAGWRRVQWRDLTGGIVALHRAVRPG
jgi:demethylmenaquinone methyltransferase/2-methoxy-6-polyprenyl-1,4-benzoquinol methylase